MSFKLLKDPIYGYVKVDSKLMSNVIDSACFQRLRNIRQTSYAPLYPASFHNRFLHSIGVFYLGKRAFSSIKSSLEKASLLEDKEEMSNVQNLFELACLLHDVGHAPFSHTGERFFAANSADSPTIYDLLKDAIQDTDFNNDVDYYHKNGKSAAPHEIMSCIVAIKTFGHMFKSLFDRSFFSRCITGYKYRNISDKKFQIYNCIIELLNSTIIDVDRLDYIIRDAHTTGFQSVSIDYDRLLDGICVVKKEGHIHLGYHKSALSVIENVIYAHDSERKWIQNHPTILYEYFLLQHAMRSIDKTFSHSKAGKRFFSYESLSYDGHEFPDKGRVCLLADEDVLYIMKNICHDALTKEFFGRNNRRHPIWKSEAEYRALFDRSLGPENLDRLEGAFKDIEKYLIDNLSIPIINDKTLQYVMEQEAKIERTKEKIDSKDYDSLKLGIRLVKKWLVCLQKIAKEYEFPFDYVVISANKFKSGFAKKDLEEILISFPSLELSPHINDVSTILSSSKTRDNFFYLFLREKENGQEIDANAIANKISAELFK